MAFYIRRLSIFFDPYSYDFLSTSNLTPWVTLSWYIDYLLSGLDPVGYRVYHLLSFLLMIILVYLVLLKISSSVWVATCFSCAIAVLPAAQEIADTMAHRHYIEGMVFSLLSVWFVLRYNSSKRSWWLIVSALFYALATTAEEIYTPLPGILFFMLHTEVSRKCEGRQLGLFLQELKQRLLLIVPYAVVAVAYVIWRIYMLGGVFGDYSQANQSYAAARIFPVA